MLILSASLGLHKSSSGELGPNKSIWICRIKLQNFSMCWSEGLRLMLHLYSQFEGCLPHSSGSYISVSGVIMRGCTQVHSWTRLCRDTHTSSCTNCVCAVEQLSFPTWWWVRKKSQSYLNSYACTRHRRCWVTEMSLSEYGLIPSFLASAFWGVNVGTAVICEAALNLFLCSWLHINMTYCISQQSKCG